MFAQHGLWFGTCRNPSKLNPKGYFENVPIKTIMQARYPDVPAKGIATPDPILRHSIIDALRGDGYPGGPWGFKCTALYAPALLAAFPDAHKVCVLRDPRGIFASTRATKMFGKEMSDDELQSNILKHQGFMMGLVNDGAFPVYTDDLNEGDFSSVIAALEGCGFKPDTEKIGQFVEPRHWHYKR